MLARLPLRSKLILVVSVPLFVILGFAGFGIANRLDDLDAQRQYGHLRLPNDALVAAQDALEEEGVLTTWLVAADGDAAVATRLERARTATDRAVVGVAAAGRGLSADDVSNGTLRSWDALDARYDTLATLRRQADEQAGLPAAFADRYEGLNDATIDVSARLARDVQDRTLSDDMLGIVNLRREQAAAADDAMIVLPFLVTGSSTRLNEWITATGAQADARSAFLAGASTDERTAFDRVRADLPEDPFREAAGDAPSAFPATTVTPQEYYAAWRDRQAAFAGTITAVQRVVDGVAADLEAEALRAVLAYGLGISLLVLLVLVLAWVMIRSVNRSLHSLTVRARDVAENQLPHLVDTLQRGGGTTHVGPIPPLAVESRDEIGALAQAFNTIQETTVRVAEEQAALLRKGIGDLYVNLARRNQSLVDRQISLLDALEARAEDPDQLASLFELDHLATRMRRNAESLLVLSGAGQSRQWTEAIPILDVVRAASGEIADFARVGFVGFEGDIAVTGNAVADVTHILAELLENATTFSPPGTPVVVAGMLAERRFVVSITDEGIGMDDARLAAANALLQSPPPPGLALSRTLGLHVVAHLAARYGVRVQLRRSAANGVTAIVALPATVLTRVGEPGPVRPGDHQPSATPTHATAGAPASAAGWSSVPPSPPWPTAAPAEPTVEDPGPVWVAPGPVAGAGVGPVAGAGAGPAPVLPEPGIDLPAFDPAAAVPTVAVPVEPVNGSGGHRPVDPTVDPGDLPRRAPGASPLGGDASAGSLPLRTPGNHLSHQPDGGTPAPGEYDARPRPERVHDLLTHHLRGIRDGRESGATEPGAPHPDREDLP